MNKLHIRLLLIITAIAFSDAGKVHRSTPSVPTNHPSNHRKTTSAKISHSPSHSVTMPTKRPDHEHPAPEAPRSVEHDRSTPAENLKQSSSQRNAKPSPTARSYHRNKDYGEVKNILNTLREKAAASVPAQQPRLRMDNPPMSLDRSVNQDETELSRNKNIKNDLFEGDVVLTISQAKGLLDSVDTNLSPHSTGQKTKRKVVKDADERWPGNIVYYMFENGLATYKVSVIQAAIKIWEGNTCLHFHQGTGTGDYILFVNGPGCYSSVGRLGGEQEVSIGDGCESTGIASHEIGHTLGFWHEQSRFDRNDYVKLVTQNIYAPEYGNFARASRRVMDDFGVPYDLGSVMHYGPKAFSVNDMITIRTLDKNYQRTIGQRDKLSFADIKQINMAYCSAVCGNNLPCLHGGYPDPAGGGTKCQTCRCPTGFGGVNCDTVEPSITPACGEVLIATSEWRTLTTLDASPNRHCNWLIKTSPNTKITLEIVNVDMRCRDTCASYLEVKTGPNFVSTGARFCCQNSWQNPILSDGSEMVLIYRTDTHKNNSGAGAQARYRSDKSDSGSTGNDSPNAALSDAAGGAAWGQWGEWSRCTATCGGCGLKFRTRTCSVIPRYNCSGEASERVACGEAICASDVSRVSMDAICRFRTRVPCSYFYSDSGANGTPYPRFEVPKDFDGKRQEVELRSERHNRRHRYRYQDHQQSQVGDRSKRDAPPPDGRGGRVQDIRSGHYCNAYGYYPCSRNSPYFYREMDSTEVQGRDDSSSDGDQCCSGFEAQGTACVRRQNQGH